MIEMILLIEKYFWNGLPKYIERKARQDKLLTSNSGV
jgi:hypothetical protein